MGNNNDFCIRHTVAIDLLSDYLSQSGDLTYLEMEEFPELPPTLIECIESNKKIKHLKILQVGPAVVISSTIKVLAPNLESFALGEADLTPDQFLELLKALPVGLKDLRLSSKKITHDLLAAPELLDLLDNVLELDLTDCVAIKTETVEMLTKLKKLTRLVLVGCTGLSDQELYPAIYMVHSTSLLQVVTHHGNADPDPEKICSPNILLLLGEVLEYQNDSRRIYVNRLATNIQFYIRNFDGEVRAFKLLDLTK